MRYPCPCCGYFTYTAPAQKSAGFICPVCFWEYDPFTVSDDEPSCSNHHISLRDARSNFKDFGACEASMLPHVRPPKPEEE